METDKRLSKRERRALARQENQQAQLTQFQRDRRRVIGLILGSTLGVGAIGLGLWKPWQQTTDSSLESEIIKLETTATSDRLPGSSDLQTFNFLLAQYYVQQTGSPLFPEVLSARVSLLDRDGFIREYRQNPLSPNQTDVYDTPAVTNNRTGAILVNLQNAAFRSPTFEQMRWIGNKSRLSLKPMTSLRFSLTHEYFHSDMTPSQIARMFNTEFGEILFDEVLGFALASSARRDLTAFKDFDEMSVHLFTGYLNQSLNPGRLFILPEFPGRVTPGLLLLDGVLQQAQVDWRQGSNYHRISDIESLATTFGVSVPETLRGDLSIQEAGFTLISAIDLADYSRTRGYLPFVTPRLINS